MNLISLELNRSAQSPDASSGSLSLIEQMRMLITGIALHSIEDDHAEFTQFQRAMAEIAHSLTDESSTEDLMAAIVKALALLEAYNQKIGGVFKTQMEELRAMIASMTDTLQFIVSSSEISAKQLSFMESQLQRAATLDDLRQLRTYTSACLHLVRRENNRIQTENQEKITALKSDVQRLSNRLKAAAVEESEDPTTGLPARAAAEHAIENRISAGKPCFLSLFLMDRLAAINGRFGNSVGDEIIMSCAQMLAKRLSGATLYRWSGPSFLAIFDPLVPLAQAETRCRQAASQQLERNIDVGDRMTLVVIGFACLVQTISAQTSPGELFDKLDAFLSQHNRERD